METEKPNLIRNQVPQLPVSMKLSGIEYSFDAKNGVWVQRDITTGSILTNKQRPLTMSELEQRIKETKDELTKIIRNNENMKKIIAEKKNATKDLEQITVAESIEVEKLKKYRDKIVHLKQDHPDVFI